MKLDEKQEFIFCSLCGAKKAVKDLDQHVIDFDSKPCECVF